MSLRVYPGVGNITKSLMFEGLLIVNLKVLPGETYNDIFQPNQRFDKYVFKADTWKLKTQELVLYCTPDIVELTLKPAVNSLPMRLISITLFLFSFNCCYFPTKVTGQLTEKDSINYLASVKNAMMVYHQSLQHPSGLYNGSQYVNYAYLIKTGHPFFQSDSLNNGSILYDSVLYENVPMLYDIVKEMVVINDPFNVYKINLINEKVNGFTLLNHTFIRLEADSLNQLYRTGFYDRLFQGKISLYEREIKKIQEIIQGQELQRLIYDENSFYLEMYGKFYPVNSKRSLLNLLKKRKKDVQQFIRKNKFNYRHDKENTLVKVMTFYDGLKN